MSTFGSGSTTTAGASITLRNFTGTDGNQAGTDGLVPGPAIAQEGYVLGAGGDWTLEVAAINNLLDSSERIATTAFVQNRVGQILAGGGITLGGIQDVNLGGLSDGDFIKYNLGANEWQVHTLTIGSISDVNLAGLQAGNTIVWDAVNSEWVPGQGGGGGAANLDELGDVTIAGVANKHFLVNNGAGQFVNRVIDTTDLNDGTDIVLETRGATFGAFDYDFTGANSITVKAPVGVNDATTKAYVDGEVATKQPLDATLTALAGVVTAVDKLIYATNVDVFATTDLTNFGRTLIANANAGDARTDLGLGSAAVEPVGTFAQVANNLADLADAGTARTNLGLGTSAVEPVGTFAQVANNLADLADAGTARTNLGLGTASTQAIGTFAQVANNLADLADAGTARTNLGLGTAATQNVGAFLPANTSIDALNDVDTTTNAPQNGQALVWDGANFVPGTGGKTQEEIEDIVGGMVAGNTETGITVTYADNGALAGKLDFVVDNTVVGFLAGAQNFGGDKTFSGALTATGDTDLTGANFVRVPAPAGATDATTKLYVDTGLGGKQDTNARLDDIAGLGVNANNFIVGDGANLTLKTPTDAITSLGMGVALNDLLIGSGANTFGTIATTAGMQTFLGTNLTIQAGATGDVLRVSAVDGQNIPTAFENTKLASTDLSDTADLILRDGSVAFTGAVDLGDQNITNVGDLAVSTISIADNNANGFIIKEGANNYLRFNSTNGSESVVFEKATAFNQRTDFNNTVVINESGNGVDFRVETGTQTHAIFTDGGNDRVGIFQNNPLVPLDVVGDTKITGALEITGLANLNGGIEIDNGGNKFTVSNLGAVVSVGGITDTTVASAFATGTTVGNLTLANGSITDANGSISFGDEDLSTTGTLGAGATTVTSLSVTDGNITNVGDIALDSISADNNTISINLTDNQVSALNITEGVNSYLNFVTTNGGEKIEAGAIGLDLTNAVVTATTQPNNLVEGDSTLVATTAFVRTVVQAVGNVADLDDLADVNLGVKAGDATSVALANAQILVYDDDNGANDNSFKNVSLSGDITITNAGVATIANNAITTAKINDGEVTNAKMANPYLDIIVGANTDRLNLGETFTIEGTANEIEVAGLADAGGANAGATLTIGLPDDVTIAQDLTVTRDLVVTRNLTVNGTTTTIDTTNLDIEDAVIRLNKNVDGQANGRDIGIFMERGTDGQDAIFYFDEGEDIFKLGTTTSAHTDTDFDATTTFGTLKLATLTATNNSTIGGTLGITGDVSVNGGQATITALTGNITTKGDFVVLNPANGNASITISADNDDVLITSFGGDIYFDNENLWTTGSLSAGSTSLTSLVVNDAGAAVDFRVEGDAQTHLLYTDGTNDRVGINTNAPDTQFHVVGDTKLVGALTQTTGAVVFNNDLGDFDFRVAGDNEANLLFVDASADSIGIGKNNPAKKLDVVGDVGISTTLDVTGKTTLAGSLDLTTGSATGITFRSEIGNNGVDADQILLRVNQGGAGPVYKSIKWVAADDRFSVESSLKSEGNFTVGADQFTVNATNGNTSVVGTLGVGGATTINNAGGTADLIVQNNGADVLNVDVSAGTTTVTGQFKTDDLRAKTAGTGNFKVRIEDNVANALEISDATNGLSFMVFDTRDNAELINFNQDIVVKGEVNIENSNTSGLFFNSNRAGVVSEDATLITIEGGTNKNEVVLGWDTSDNALNLNAEAQVHLQGLAGSNALTIGGALVGNATIVMTTAGAITLAGTLDSPTINTDKITNKNATSLEVELADAKASALVIRQGNNGESYLTIDTNAQTLTFNEDVNFDASATFDTTVEVTGITTLNDSLKVNKAGSDTGIIFNADRAVGNVPNAQDFDAVLIHVEDGGAVGATEAFVKWDDSESSFKVEGGKLFSATEISVGTEAANVLTKNFTVGTDGAVTAKTPAGASNTTDVPTTEWVRDLRLGDFDQVNTAGFNANDQILVWDQDNSTFKAGTIGNLAYGKDDAIDDVGAALVKGSVINGVLNDVNGASTGADTISFTLDDANDIINLALGVSSRNLTDVQDVAPQDTQVLRYVDVNNRYEPTTLGTASDVDTGLDNGEIPTLTTHYLANQSETADLILTGRVIETIDYGSVSEAFDGATDYAIDMNGTGLGDTVLYGAEDYGMLVV